MFTNFSHPSHRNTTPTTFNKIHFSHDEFNDPYSIDPTREKARRANLERTFDSLPENCLV